MASLTTRPRIRAIGSVALVGVLVLSACGTAGSASQQTPAPSVSSSASSLVPAAEGKTAYPLTLETPWGKTELAHRPERIAAVTPSQDDAEILAALGVTPIIASSESTDAWLEEALTQPIPQRFTPGDSKFPVEQIAKSDPDLIVVLNTDLTAEYAKLSAIAPVLATAERSGSESSVANDWKSSIQRIGEALDLQAAAQQALDDEDASFATFRAEHPELKGLTASYLVYYGDKGGLQFHSSEGSPSAAVFEGMGFAPNPNAKKFTYRQEVMSAVDADVIVFSDNSDGNYAKITEQRLFKNLKAVQENHLILIDNRSEQDSFVIDGTTYQGNLPWALARSGPLSAPWAATKLAPALKATLGK